VLFFFEAIQNYIKQQIFLKYKKVNGFVKQRSKSHETIKETRYFLKALGDDGKITSHYFYISRKIMKLFYINLHFVFKRIP